MIIISGRKLLVPEGERHIGFKGDNLVETRIFVLTDKALFDMDFVADFGEDKGCAVLEKKYASDGNSVELRLDITSGILNETGALMYQIRGVEADGERCWHSEKGCFTVSDSHNSENGVTEEQISEFAQLERLALQHCDIAKQYSETAVESAQISVEALEKNKDLADDARTFRDEAQQFRDEAESCSKLFSDGVSVVSGISKNAAKQQGENEAGCKGWRITEIVQPELLDGVYYAAYVVDGDAGQHYTKGDVCSIRLNNNYDNCGEIDSVVGSLITVKLYGTQLSNLPSVLNSQSDGDANSFRVPDKPYAGNIDIGVSAFACGNANYAMGPYSFASGYGNKAVGKYAFAEGFNNVAVYAAHVQGRHNKSLGEQGHVEGDKNTNIAINGHVEGAGNVNEGSTGHVEGMNNTVKTMLNHAEGENNVIQNGTHSHIEGKGNTIQNGAYSHLEGSGNTTSTWYAHIEGRDNVNNHSTVHIEGMGNKSTCNMQHIQGKYNATAGCSNMAHIVGGGTSADDRKNIHTLDWDGNAFYSGSVEVSAVILRSSTPGSTKKFKLTVDDSGTLSVSAV